MIPLPKEYIFIVLTPVSCKLQLRRMIVKVTFHKCKRELLVSIPPFLHNIRLEPSLLSSHPLVLADPSDLPYPHILLGLLG
jgi:hypothetical protein